MKIYALAFVGLAVSGNSVAAPDSPSRPKPADAEERSFAELQRAIDDPHGPAVITLESGVYRGDLVIRRPVTVRGRDGTVLEGSGTTTVVKIEGSDVAIEHVHVRRSGRRHTTEDAGIKATGERVRVSDVRIDDALFGVSFEACRSCTLERATIRGPDDARELRGDGVKLWEANDSVVRDTVVDHARDVVVWYTKRARLEDNVVRASRYGTHFMYAHDVIVRRCRFEENVVGIFAMYSMRVKLEGNVLAGAHGAAGVGLGFKDSDGIDARGNWIVANTAGTYLDNTPRTPADPVTFDGNVFALNDVALRFHGAEKGVAFLGNDFRDNADLVEVDGGGNALGAVVRGNHFTDYEGYDLDGDGKGDVAYEAKALSSEITDAHPALKFFHGTAAMGVIDAVSHAVPVLASRKLLVDPQPLMKAPEVASP